MIDVEVTSLTQKSMLHGKGRPIHLAEAPLSAVPAMEGNTQSASCGRYRPHVEYTRHEADMCGAAGRMASPEIIKSQS